MGARCQVTVLPTTDAGAGVDEEKLYLGLKARVTTGDTEEQVLFLTDKFIRASLGRHAEHVCSMDRSWPVVVLHCSPNDFVG